jgi:YVTN family beta-propeller protein
MTTTEERLTAALARAAAAFREETLRPLTAPERTRRRWPRHLVPLLAAAAVVAVLGAELGLGKLVSAPSQTTRSGSRPASTLWVVGSSIVTPVNTSTNTPGTSIKVCNPRICSAGPVVFTPDGKTAYVPNQDGDTVTVVNTVAGTAGPRINVREMAGAIAITPDGKTVYVADNFSDTVVPINTSTNTAGPAITMGRGPVAFAFTPDGKTAYVTGSAGTVTPISTATNTVGPSIKVSSGDRFPLDLVITADGKTAYVALANYRLVVPIDTATNKPGTPFTIPQGASWLDINSAPGQLLPRR